VSCLFTWWEAAGAITLFRWQAYQKSQYFQKKKKKKKKKKPNPVFEKTLRDLDSDPVTAKLKKCVVINVVYPINFGNEAAISPYAWLWMRDVDRMQQFFFLLLLLAKDKIHTCMASIIE
jgi:hypothetical protein